jgi:hypothetical protein
MFIDASFIIALRNGPIYETEVKKPLAVALSDVGNVLGRADNGGNENNVQ